MNAVCQPWSSIAPDLSRKARSSLTFRCDPVGRTFIAEQRTEYPVHMTRPFRLPADPEGMLTLYLQSSSGGLYRGDDLRLEVDVEAGAAVHLTTQAGTVVHHTREGEARQTTHLRVGARGFCEYLPDPLILFSGANLSTRTHVVLDPDATLVLADAFTVHDPEGGEAPFNRLNSELCIESSSGEVLAIDRFDIDGRAFACANSALQGDQRNHATLLVLAPGDLNPLLETLRMKLGAATGIYGGVSILPGARGLWCRFLADDAVALGVVLENMWMTIRTGLTGITPVHRRK